MSTGIPPFAGPDDGPAPEPAAEPDTTTAPPDTVTDTARVVVEVVAGLIPGRNPDPTFTRRWVISSREWHDTPGARQAELLAVLAGRASGYATLLMLQPDRLNWVRTDWIWL